MPNQGPETCKNGAPGAREISVLALILGNFRMNWPGNRQNQREMEKISGKFYRCAREAQHVSDPCICYVL